MLKLIALLLFVAVAALVRRAARAQAPTEYDAVARRCRRAMEEIEAALDPRFGRQSPIAAKVFVSGLLLGSLGMAGALGAVSTDHIDKLEPVAKLALPGPVGEAVAPLLTDAPVQAPAAAEVAAPAPEAAPAEGAAAPASAAPDTTEPAPAAPPPSTPTVRAKGAARLQAVAAPAPPSARGALPIGKGMWIWLPGSCDGGDPAAIVARAKHVGLTHVFVRTSTLRGGFDGGPFLDALLPVAHANGIRVYGWEFPHLDDPGADVQRAWQAISYRTPDGHSIDGFNADIETHSEGTKSTPDRVFAYGSWLRQAVGPNYPLIVTVPNPTPRNLSIFPYAEAMAHFDAVSPMIYWLNRDPGTDTARAMEFFKQFNKPIIPVGQAYDGGPEGGRPGVPPPEEIIKFLQVAEEHGAVSASFWSWQHADQRAWDTITMAGEFKMHSGAPASLTRGMRRSYQALLNQLGFSTAADGEWSQATDAAVRGYQKAARLPETGVIDDGTMAMLLTPFRVDGI